MDNRNRASLEGLDHTEEDVLQFFRIPRSLLEIAVHLVIAIVTKAMTAYVNPMAERGLIRMATSESPKSYKRRFAAAE